MATIKQRGRAWQLQWSEAGQQHRVSLGPVSRREAEIALARKELELRGEVPQYCDSRSLGAFADEYLDWHQREFPASHYRTRQILEQHILPWFGHLRPDSLAPADVERWKAARAAKSGTVAKELRTLQALINKAVEWGLLHDNPIRYVRPPRQTDSKPIHWYSREELERLYCWSPYHHAVWRLLANTGLRRGEALQARRAHVQGEFLIVPSTEAERTKSGKWRQVPLTEGARLALRYLGQDRLIPDMARTSLSRAFARCLKRADLPGSIHSLRHTYGAHLSMAGVPLRTIQVLMGHSTVAVTERHYSHLAPDYLAGIATKINL